MAGAGHWVIDVVLVMLMAIGLIGVLKTQVIQGKGIGPSLPSH